MSDPIVGHKTLCDAEGNYSHEPLRKDEADALWAVIERHRIARAEALPDVQTAIRAMFDAYDRLRELGWREACYCPKDGSSFEVIEPGSTGIHPCFYSGEWPTGYFMVGEGIDCGPSRPILFRSTLVSSAAPAPHTSPTLLKIARDSLLNSVMIAGKPIGECSAGVARSWSRARGRLLSRRTVSPTPSQKQPD